MTSLTLDRKLYEFDTRLKDKLVTPNLGLRLFSQWSIFVFFLEPVGFGELDSSTSRHLGRESQPVARVHFVRFTGPTSWTTTQDLQAGFMILLVTFLLLSFSSRSKATCIEFLVSAGTTFGVKYILIKMPTNLDLGFRGAM